MTTRTKILIGLQALLADFMIFMFDPVVTRYRVEFSGVGKRQYVNTTEPSFEAYSTLTCPECGHRSKDRMPTNACQYFYDCKGCAVVLKAQPGDCCVYCSYGDVKCPPIQQGDACCA